MASADRVVVEVPAVADRVKVGLPVEMVVPKKVAPAVKGLQSQRVIVLVKDDPAKAVRVKVVLRARVEAGRAAATSISIRWSV